MSASAIIHSGGARFLNKVSCGLLSPGATWYLGLRTLDGAGGHPADVAAADTLTSNLAEVSGAGYARAAITLSTDVSEALSGSDSLLTFAQKTFNFTGSVSGITHAFIATTNDNTGVLIASAPLAATRNVANGDVIKDTFTLTQRAA